MRQSARAPTGRRSERVSTSSASDDGDFFDPDNAEDRDTESAQVQLTSVSVIVMFDRIVRKRKTISLRVPHEVGLSVVVLHTSLVHLTLVGSASSCFE